MTFSPASTLLELPSGREGIEETPTGELKPPALSISAPLAKHLRNTNTLTSPVIIFQPPAIHSSSEEKEIPCRLVPLQNPINYTRIKIKFKKELGNKNQGPKSKLSGLQRHLPHFSCKVLIPPSVPKWFSRPELCSDTTWKLCSTDSKNRLQLLKEFRQLLEKDHFDFILPFPSWGLVFDVADLKWICQRWLGLVRI